MERKTIAAFDFDGTITYKDTLLEFIHYAVGLRRFWTGFFLHLPLLLAYKLGVYPNWKVKQRIFAWFFAGMDVEDFDQLCQGFYRHCGKALLRPAACCCIGEHIRGGDEVVLVSASIENWVNPFAQALGIRYSLGTQIETDGRRLTGRFATPNCYGREKVRRLLAVFPNREDYRLVAYGDSRGDRALLDFADEAYYKPFRK